ncbi:hypothetical protein Sa4125_35630 [Aureimonas sp. SA4125]|uniref:DUF3750 domain-containing protein n=1 Tax=Aureimonas sp. SA4125 TaxID=2826993 RepID=UPI001CC3B88D|nr:DUF3750 domain-containing protein [Aureimonas sp. SA4125]BDA86021.1 hypothetical protein Sa4125_35630 [Aureimonas sp. SA4125]
MRLFKILLLTLGVVYVAPALLAATLFWFGDHPASWGSADWSSAKMLPDPAASSEAAVYVMSARTGGLKGAISSHSWIVVKEKGARRYERWDKVGWGAPIRHNAYAADGRWYSNAPEIVVGRHGAEAEGLIPKIRAAVAAYPFAERGGYHIFPGPNSNTFVAFVLAETAGLAAALPPVAVGRDYPVGRDLVTLDRERGELRLSLFGYAGITIGRMSGFEVNLLGLVAGIDPERLAVKIPAFGTFALRPATV